MSFWGICASSENCTYFKRQKCVVVPKKRVRLFLFSNQRSRLICLSTPPHLGYPWMSGISLKGNGIYCTTTLPSIVRLGRQGLTRLVFRFKAAIGVCALFYRILCQLRALFFIAPPFFWRRCILLVNRPLFFVFHPLPSFFLQGAVGAFPTRLLQLLPTHTEREKESESPVSRVRQCVCNSQRQDWNCNCFHHVMAYERGSSDALVTYFCALSLSLQVL